MPISRSIFVSLLLLSSNLFSQTSIFESAYTDINIEKNCTPIEVYDNHMGGGFYCGKYQDIDIEIWSDDLRETIDLVRDTKRHKLDFYTTVTPNYTWLGDKIEWRYNKAEVNNPSAMIVRLNINTDQENRTDSYLIISKITQDTICVVQKVAPQINQNNVARGIANIASTLPCLTNYGQKQKDQYNE